LDLQPISPMRRAGRGVGLVAEWSKELECEEPVASLLPAFLPPVKHSTLMVAQQDQG
jgi:hypothetical protein